MVTWSSLILCIFSAERVSVQSDLEANPQVKVHPTPAVEPTLPGELLHSLAAAQECAECHLYFNPDELADDPDINPWSWQGTLMANAARDPVFWAAVAIASQDRKSPEETHSCIRCHSPQAFLSGRADAIDAAELLPVDFDGVSCDLCHRLQNNTVDGVHQVGNAQYRIDDLAGADGKVARSGPWTYAELEGPEHAWKQDLDHLATSEACGTCHDVSTPRERVDNDGNGTGRPFNEQRTYSEWKNSAYSQEGKSFQSCQDCHMPALKNVAGCKSFQNTGRTHPEGGRRHDLAGANVGMLGILKKEFGSAGSAEIDDYHFDASIQRTQETLAKAAQIDVVAPNMIDLNEGLQGLEVTVTNLSGHKLPSGYSEGRLMWIEVLGKVDDLIVFESGRWDAANTMIHEGPQFRSYRAIAQRFSDETEFHLLLSNHWLEDSRIPPLGLRQDPETDPVGDRYELKDGIWPNYDQVQYDFDPPQRAKIGFVYDADTITIQIRLLYWMNTTRYIDFLAEENTTNQAGMHVLKLFEGEDVNPPQILTEKILEIPLIKPDDDSTSASDSDSSPSDSDDNSSEASEDSSEETSPSDSSSDSDDDSAKEQSKDASTEASSEGCQCNSPSSTQRLATFLSLGLLCIFGRKRTQRAKALPPA